MVPSGLLVVGLEEELFPTLCSNADSEFINHTCRASYWSKTIKDIEVCPMFFHQNPPKNINQTHRCGPMFGPETDCDRTKASGGMAHVPYTLRKQDQTYRSSAVLRA